MSYDAVWRVSHFCHGLLGVLKELFDGHFYISLNGAKKPRSDCLSRVDRNHCRPPIRMFQERVAAPSSNDVEAKSFQNAHDVLAR